MSGTAVGWALPTGIWCAVRTLRYLNDYGQANATSFEVVMVAMRCICSMTEACCSSVSAAQQSSSTMIS